MVIRHGETKYIPTPAGNALRKILYKWGWDAEELATIDYVETWHTAVLWEERNELGDIVEFDAIGGGTVTGIVLSVQKVISTKPDGPEVAYALTTIRGLKNPRDEP